MPSDPVARLILSLAVVLATGKLGSHLASRSGQPSVLGELVAGIVLGNLALLGYHGLDYLKDDQAVDMLAQLGVIVLLFQIGLESTVGQMLRIGVSSMLVAALGTLGSFFAGWAVTTWLLRDAGLYTQLFVAAAVTATSIGITARVFHDLNRTRAIESRVILGASVVDDVIGLVVLAVFTDLIGGLSRGEAFSYGMVGLVFLKAIVFLVASLAVGVLTSKKLFHLASRLKASGVLLTTGLVFCFVLAWLASVIGLSPIVGAFSAGLILEDVHFRHFVDRGERTLTDLVEPIASFLIPIFFVLIGIRADLRTLANPGVLLLATALTVAAIVGKQLCALGVVGQQGNRLTVAIGMIPRGEVALIFANIGMSVMIGGRQVVDASTFAAIVIMVMVTTVVTPPALKWSLERVPRPVRRSPA